MSLTLSRITKRADFVAAAKSGRKCVTHSLVLQAVASPAPDGAHAIRFGVTATKKLGNAVVRNRAKRRMRAAAQAVLPLHGQAQTDYVLIGRDLCVHCPYESLLRDLVYAVKRVGGSS